MRIAPSPHVQQATPATTRRGLMLSVAAISLVPSPAALAFGNGFPGYDINVEGRKRALDRNKREMEADRKKAAEFRAKKAAKALETSEQK